MEKQEILLETGTNEVEIAEFVLSGQSFGVNVAKVKEFIPFESVTVNKIPDRHSSVAGIYMLRGKAVPLIELNTHLGLKLPEDTGPKVVVVTEFNNMTTSFVADHIKRIHRITWDHFRPLTGMILGETPHVVGTVNIDGDEVMILDLEHIVGEIFPQSVVNYDESKFIEQPQTKERAQVKIIFAEDSAIIRKQVSKILKEVGFEELSVVDNGQAALNLIKSLVAQADAEGKDLGEYLNLVLTDIEMPQMDGLALCRNIKRELKLQIPVVIFSSLINEQMARKCDQVGADAYASKPETERLINLLDSLTLNK